MKMNRRRSRKLTVRAILTLALAAAAFAVGGCGGNSSGKINYSRQADLEATWSAGAASPPSPQTLLAMAKIFAAKGRDPEAAFVLKKIMQEYPKFLPAYVEMAEVHMRSRQVESAIQVLSVGLKVSPDDPVLLNNIGMCWVVKGQYDLALSMFSRAAASRPGDSRHRANMALALGMLGRYEESLALYEQVLGPAEAHQNLSIICAARNDGARSADERAAAEKLRNIALARTNNSRAEAEGGQAGKTPSPARQQHGSPP